MVRSLEIFHCSFLDLENFLHSLSQRKTNDFCPGCQWKTEIDISLLKLNWCSSLTKLSEVVFSEMCVLVDQDPENKSKRSVQMYEGNVLYM
ncbi:hypothetical protein ACROYT_G016722 [Oculina patagonica]